MTNGQETTQEPNPNYHAYLLRIWRDSEQAPWRASITHVVTGRVFKFANSELVWTHIQSQLEVQPAEAIEVDRDQHRRID